MRFLRYLSNHFVNIRTLLKRIYEIRRLVIWIMQIEEAVQTHDIEKLKELMECNLKLVII